MDIVKEKPVVHPKKISEINVNDNLCVRALVVQVFGPSFFNVCSQCGKKVGADNECIEHGKVIPEKRAIINFVLDDGTGVIRATLFNDQVNKIASNIELSNTEAFMNKRNEIIGKEYIIEANARRNRLYETVELVVNDIYEVDVEKLIEELEK